jgi:hypothetical protein
MVHTRPLALSVNASPALVTRGSHIGLKVAVIENEFGEVGIDDTLVKQRFDSQEEVRMSEKMHRCNAVLCTDTRHAHVEVRGYSCACSRACA